MFLSFLLVLAPLTQCAIYRRPYDLPSNVAYDFIIVGGAFNVVCEVFLLIHWSNRWYRWFSSSQQIVRSFSLQGAFDRGWTQVSFPHYEDRLPSQLPHSNEGVLNTIVPGFSSNLENSLFDWNFTTTPQKGLNGRSISLQRGHGLGGSSTVSTLLVPGPLFQCHGSHESLFILDGMLYTRGSSDDYDRFARVTGERGWSWNALQPYVKKVMLFRSYNISVI